MPSWLCRTAGGHAACTLFEKIEGLADRTGILEPCVVPWMGDAMGAYAVTHRLADASRIYERLQASIGTLPCRSRAS